MGTYTSMTNPRIPLTTIVHIIALGNTFEALFNSSAICAAASPPMKEPTGVIEPTKHASPTAVGQPRVRERV